MKNNLYKLLFLVVFTNTFVVNAQVVKKEAAVIQLIVDPGDCTDPIAWYEDGDQDGLGNIAEYQMACEKPPGYYVTNSNDCDDSNASIKGPSSWYMDSDGDGYGALSPSMSRCTKPVGYVSNNTDCNDGDANVNPNTKWYLDSNGDGVISDLDGTPVYQCTQPNSNYYTIIDKKFHWTHDVLFDIKGVVTGASRTYFDDLGKPNVSLSKDFVGSKIWGTETTYDNFGRPNKSSFVAPSPLTSFGKVGFLTSGANYSLTSNLTTYYSDSNTDELYQATATQPYSQNNYDNLNPGNIINVVGGNQIGGQWKTGYSYTVPAAQEMYYVYGLNYYDGTVSTGKEEVITKFFKSVKVDANGIENVAFTDGEGKVLATARSGGTVTYPVISLIGTQGFVDVHIPNGILAAQITLLGATTLYKAFNLKTGVEITPITTSSFVGGNAYRIVAITPPNTDPKAYVTVTTGALSNDAGALGISYRVNYYDYSVNVYNKTGQLIKSVQPNGYVASAAIIAAPAYLASANFATTYTYNALGQVIQITSADEGTSKFAYRKDGQIRYSQSALQGNSNMYASYTNYDTYGRPIESGAMNNYDYRGSGIIYGGVWATLSNSPDNPLYEGLGLYDQTFTIYDDPLNNKTSVSLPPNLTLNAVLTTAGISTANYTQKNLSGNVAITYTKPGATITAITWYSYDLYGRSEWVVQYNEGIGAKTIHYNYDYKGNVGKVIYQKDKIAELFAHRYTYDGNDVLKKVETSIDNTTFITHADYTYYKTGELKRVNIAQGAQGIDYVYTLGGQLKSINHPSLEAAKDPGADTNDIFGITLDYYSGDYLRTGRNITSSPTAGADYNGNIKAARWANKSTSMDFISGIVNQKGYLYSYDRNNWLTGATFGNANASTAAITAITAYKEAGLSYDANGNIKTLQRTNNAGTTVDNLTYNYTNTGKNQLNSVTEAAAVTADVADIETQAAGNYVYDAIGQMTRNIQENLYYFYNTQGLVTEVRKGPTNVLVKFFYNERGQRIKKESYNTGTYLLQSTTFYELDLSGNTMAVHNLPSGGSITQTDLPIYGLSRLGVYNRASVSSTYEITDHLGNVRAVIKKVGGSPVIQSYADYYPFGEQLPARNSMSNYRYAFQGQELDGETGMEAFQLRLWDGRIGRWLSPDPMRQYASPYLGMGNNPISRIDPNGGSDYPERDGYGCGDTWNDSDGSWTWDSDQNMWLGQNGTTSNWSHSVTVGNVNSPMISQYQPNLFGRIEDNYLNSDTNDSFLNSSLKTLAKIPYNILDDATVYYSRNFTKKGARHLNGFGADPKEVLNSGLNTIMLITPSPIKGMPSQKTFSSIATPSLINKFNVATFGSIFKGTFLTKLEPATRGTVIVKANELLTFFTSRSMFITYSNSASKKINQE